MRLDFLGLQAFLSVAERGSFKRAAAHLNISPTALSHRIKKFEESIGTRLFSRTTRQVTLTQAGLELLPRARKIIEEMDIAWIDLHRRGKPRHEQLAIGCLPTITYHYLPKILRQFSCAHPAINIRVFDNAATELRDLVQAGTIEFALTIVAANSWDLDIEILQKEPFLLVCHKSHRLADAPFVTWADLEHEPLIRTSMQAGNRMIIDDALGIRKDRLNWRYEVQHTSSAISMVVAGLGVTVLPRLAIDLEAMPDIRLRCLKNPSISRTLGIVSRRDTPLSPLAEHLREMIIAHLNVA